MENADYNDESDKMIMEDLSKEELITKCNELVDGSKKKEQTEISLQAEIAKLKKELQIKGPVVNPATEEIIECITKEKLNLVTQIDSLTTQNKKLSEDLNTCRTKLSTCSDENVSYKRQITRLTDENEQLISDLETLESKLNELQGIGILQQKQLLHLEEAKIQEQQMNSRLLENAEEIKCLKDENNSLTSRIDKLQVIITEKDSVHADLNEQLISKKAIVCDLSNKLSNTRDLGESNNKLKEKIKFFHSKVIKFASSAKDLKEDRNAILKLFKTYNSQVVEWKEKLAAAQKDLANQLKNFEIENTVLKQKLNELELLESNRSTEVNLDSTVIESVKDSKKDIGNELQKLEAVNLELAEEIKVLKDQNKLYQQKDDTIAEFEKNLRKTENEIQNLNIQNENYSKEIVQLQTINNKLNDEITLSSQQIEVLSVENKRLSETIEELQANIEKMQTRNLISVALQTEEILTNKPVDTEKNLAHIKKENNELLTENAEINQVTKSEDCDESQSNGTATSKYEKLRELAIKLKGKIRELNQKNDELQKRCTSNVKTIQNLQNETDKLQDDVEKYKKECKQQLNSMNSLANDQAQCKLQLAAKEETIQSLQSELEATKSDKASMETWKKQVSVKVQSLRKELEANNLVKKEFEARIVKLNSELETKEQVLKSEVESHKKTKALLDQSNNERKKHSMLSLEMEDYEHSVKEISKKLETKQEEVTQLTGQIESLKITINALRDQNKLLEEQAHKEESNANAILAEITSYKKKIVALEEDILTKDDKIQNLNQALETQRSETEELSTELSKAIAEHQKVNANLRNERDNLLSRNLGMEQIIRETRDNLKLKEEELKVTQQDYERYKLRVQSVLKQNQTRDFGNEERLFEEISTLMAQNTELKSRLEENHTTQEKIEALEVTINQLSGEKETDLATIKELEAVIADLQNQYSQLSASYERTVNENAETIGSLKTHADSLSQRYRQKISEQESRHVKEIMDLQNRLTPTELPVVLSMPREEGEGSESVDSTNESNHHQPMPLERLLSSNLDQEHTNHLEKLLSDQENKVLHLTALLADTEQELTRYVQMNGLLKEEIRRQQRSEEREKHAENLEYLKNVIFKFLSLNSGDERTRLVPVINTILKLSPEETKQLLAVAKGESTLRGWTNLLSSWSPGKMN